jgi:hypothetical protein
LILRPGQRRRPRLGQTRLHHAGPRGRSRHQTRSGGGSAPHARDKVPPRLKTENPPGTRATLLGPG